MGIFDVFKPKPTPTKVQVKEAPGAQINKNTYKNFVVKAIGFIAGQGQSRGEMSPSEYDLEEIKRAADSDSYIKMALMKYSYMIYKAGYHLKSDNEKALEYLRMRFRIMSFATNKPTDILFQEIADDLVKYSNAFLIKSRVDKLMPGVQAKGVFNDKPIGGYFRVDPDTIKIERDKNGAIKKYEQGSASGDTKTFAPTEVIHFYLDKDASNAFGTPRILAAMEDVKLLRRIEGNVVSLIYRFAIPIYQWAIGLPEAGFQATDKEIQDAQKEIENMPLDGVIVTNEKTNIKAIGAEGQALDASAYLQYFEKRVFSALGVSEAQMGRGGAKQDADSMEAQVHDTVKYIQRVMAVFVENYVLNELLLEGGFNPIFNEADIVRYEFDEISLDTKIKVENHEMTKYQSNVTPFEEMRRSMGKKDNVDESRLYKNMIEQKAALEQIDAKNQGAKEIAGMRGTGTQGNGTTPSQKPNSAATNRNRPTNQHGTTSAKVKESLDDDVIDSISESVDLKEKTIRNEKKHKKTFDSIYKKYENLRNDITETNSDRDLLFPIAKDSMLADIKIFIQMYSFDGMQAAIKEINSIKNNHNLMPAVSVNLQSFFEEAEAGLEDILKDIQKRIKDKEDSQEIISTFDSLEYRLRFMFEFIMPKVYWYSFVKTGAHFDFDKAYIKFSNSSDADNHPSEINPKQFSMEDIPAYHSFCDCKVSFKAGDK